MTTTTNEPPKPPLPWFLSYAPPVASIIAILTAVIGGIWFLATLDGRVSALEGQVKALLVLPASGSSSGGGQGGSAQAGVSNAIAQACADLARKEADLTASGFSGAGLSVREVARNLGCLVGEKPK